MKFAAYDNSAIYAIGDTPNETAARACQDAGDPQAGSRLRKSRTSSPPGGGLVGTGTAENIEVGRNGYLTETT